MKIVKNETKELGKEGGDWLKRLIDSSIEKDRDFFKGLKILRNLLSGKHWKNVKGFTKQEIKMVVNLAHAHVRTLVPTIFFQNPSVDCAPTHPKHAGKEQTWNAIINNTIDKIGFTEEVKKATLDSVVYPEGVLKDVLKRVDAPTSEMNSDGPNVWLTKGTPAHVRIAPDQLIVDYLVADRDVENARFIAIRYRKPLQELKLHPIYGKNISEPLSNRPATTGNLVNPITSDENDWETHDGDLPGIPDEELRTIYEVWVHQLVSADHKIQLYQKMCVLMEGQSEPIRELESWYDVMGEGFNSFPITRLVLLPIPDEAAQSELGVWQNMQMALNWLVSRITKLVESDIQIFAGNSNLIKNFSKFKQQFNSGMTRILAEVDGADAVQLIQPSFVGRDNYTLVNLLLQFIQQVSGIGMNRRGSSGIRTATEASLVDEGTKIKTDEKVAVMSTFLRQVLFKTCKMIRALAKDQGNNSWIFGIAGDAGAVKWVNFTPQDLDWLPEIRIRVNSFRKMDSMQEMQRLSGLVEIGMKMFQLYGPSVRVDVLFSMLLQSAGVYDTGKIIGDQDAQMMLQTIEISGLLIGVPAPVLESHNHAVHIKVIDAFEQSPYGQQMLAAAPEAADRLAQHRQEHIMKLQEQQEKAAQAQATAANPFSVAGTGEEPNAQSAANQLTSGDRMSVSAVPGGNGELA